MTAEVAVMNKLAIALAADSAVTIGRNTKIYNSANKVFSLSKFHPIGIMIFGNAEFMGVPWETLIKVYREDISGTSFPTVEAAASNFIENLKKTPLISESTEFAYVRGRILDYFGEIRREIRKSTEKLLTQKGSVDANDTDKIGADVIKKHHEDWSNAEWHEKFNDAFLKNFSEKYRPLVLDVAKIVFEKLPLAEQNLELLVQIIGLVLGKKPTYRDDSGVVIAGFGTNNVFPSVITFNIELRLFECLKFSRDDTRSDAISEENNASIVPFAQTDMVSTFMEGIDPQLSQMATGYLERIFDQYPELLAQTLGEKISEAEREKLAGAIKEQSQALFRKYVQDVRSYQSRIHIQPILDMVAVLPKDELATMAETLVNLTSFKRRVSAVAETVGGPTDVAVISKGDGLIWVHRKHYFEPNLNHHFFANYYRRSE